LGLSAASFKISIRAALARASSVVFTPFIIKLYIGEFLLILLQYFNITCCAIIPCKANHAKAQSRQEHPQMTQISGKTGSTEKRTVVSKVHRP